MKRNIICVVSLFLTLIILVCGCTITASASQTFYDSATTVAIKNHIEEDAGLGTYATAQGSCTDGKYAYFAINNGTTTVLKYDVNSFELVKKQSNISLGHANDMTYNSRIDKIVVAHNAPDYKIISLLDPDTLKVTQSVEIKLNIYSIAYNESMDRYIVGISGTYNFALLDGDFKLIKKFKGVDTSYIRQGADCDDNYIYFVQSGSGGNLLVIYNYNGDLVKKVSIDKALEIESIFHVGNKFFATFHRYGSFIYTLTFSKETQITYDVIFDANGGMGQMNTITVTYGKETSLSECKFGKEGYHFGGWILKRDQLNTYYGKSSTYSQSEWLKHDDIAEYTLYEDKTKVSKTTAVGNVVAKAFWIADSYRIYYDPNGGSGTMQYCDVKYSEQIALSKNTFVKKDYNFTGWSATRQVDNKTYGYAKGKSTPMWLNEKELLRPYLFADEETVSMLTYDQGVTFVANWELAFKLDKTNSKLDSYSGNDAEVTFPEEYADITEISDNAFADSTQMKSITIPDTVTTIGKDAFLGCSNLSSVYFENNMPDNTDDYLFPDSSPAIYLKKDDQYILLGWCVSEFGYSYMCEFADTYFY